MDRIALAKVRPKIMATLSRSAFGRILGNRTLFPVVLLLLQMKESNLHVNLSNPCHPLPMCRQI